MKKAKRDRKDNMSYEEKLDKISVLENTWHEAVNQTEVYNLINRHFDTPLPEGKKTKKAIVIGYDGCTCEMLNFLGAPETGAISYLLSEGGHGVFSFAGGQAYPEPVTQETSTAPGWCSMLTGTLAQENMIDDNGIIKEVEPKTLLIDLIEKNKIGSSAFYVSWGGHFEDDNSTYLKEKQYIAQNNLSAEYTCADGDDGTLENTLNNIKRDDCSDFIFSIFEYPDHFGHGFDYRSEVKEYMQAFVSSEKTGIEIIRAIESRADFLEEDWLILVTSDHGGYKCGHGGPTLEERITFIISNKKI